jgi:enterochelin esterase family protein
MPVWPALAALTEQGKLPPAVYLLIDVIDTTHRSQELPCNPDFWLAVQQELLPQVQAITPLAMMLAARWWPGKALAVCRRCMPPCTGRSVLAAC